MPLFGRAHIALVLGIAAASAALAYLCRFRKIPFGVVRFGLGCTVIVNEIIWWLFRYAHEGIRFPANLPLQLCDITVWSTAIACLTLIPVLIEFSYFAGLAGAGMAVLTPNLWSPWPSYPAMYFFIAHGMVVVAVVVLAFGKVVSWRAGAPWRAFGLLIAYAAVVGAFDAIFKTNYMYLCQKPASASLLNVFGPWPVYVFAGAALALVLFWALWLPVRRSSRGGGAEGVGNRFHNA